MIEDNSLSESTQPPTYAQATGQPDYLAKVTTSNSSPPKEQGIPSSRPPPSAPPRPPVAVAAAAVTRNGILLQNASHGIVMERTSFETKDPAEDCWTGCAGLGYCFGGVLLIVVSILITWLTISSGASYYVIWIGGFVVGISLMLKGCTRCAAAS